MADVSPAPASDLEPAPPARRATLTAALLAPVRWMPEATRKRAGLALLIAGALLFPFIVRNAGDIDAAANALAFALLTLGFGEIVPIVVRNTPDWTNGPMGLNGVISPQMFGFRFGVTSTPYYYLAAFLVALLIFVSYRLKESRIGRAWMAIREDEIAAGAMGVNRTRLKLMAFAIGAAFAGATGTFYVAKLGTAPPDKFQFPVSVA